MMRKFINIIKESQADEVMKQIDQLQDDATDADEQSEEVSGEEPAGEAAPEKKPEKKNLSPQNKIIEPKGTLLSK